MVKFLINKGPGRYDFSVAYIRGDQGDWIRCDVSFDHPDVQRSMDVTIDIRSAIPVFDNLGHLDRDNWEISGRMVPSVPMSGHHWTDSGIPWLEFKGSYGFKAPKPWLGIGELNADFDQMRSMPWWAKAVQGIVYRIRHDK